jgi:acyl carrier protein
MHIPVPFPLSDLETRMSDIESIAALLKRILRQRYKLGDGIDDASRLDALGIDSLHILDLLLDIETELGHRLEGIALPPRATLGQLAAAIADSLKRSR